MADKSKMTAYEKFSESLQKNVDENKGKNEFYNLTKEHKINELEELIELAEKISTNIDTINDDIRNSKYNGIIFFFITIFICLFGLKFFFELQKEYNSLAPFLYSTGIFFFVIVTTKLFNSITNQKKSLVNENLILEDLLNMIHSYKGIVYNDISLVKKAVIDMRLSRIKFNKQSSNKKENKAFVKKEKVAPV